ncbi:hypothetical protein ACT3S7_11360 [Corynebacterium sp. AOP34-AQ2-28]|uniref:hypothetical protein n=1 Tax=Corynebacterium sp. AOP34-AQ2-28 TaxID=3457689 RepID=UPI004034409B
MGTANCPNTPQSSPVPPWGVGQSASQLDEIRGLLVAGAYVVTDYAAGLHYCQVGWAFRCADQRLVVVAHWPRDAPGWRCFTGQADQLVEQPMAATDMPGIFCLTPDSDATRMLFDVQGVLLVGDTRAELIDSDDSIIVIDSRSKAVMV